MRELQRAWFLVLDVSEYVIFIVSDCPNRKCMSFCGFVSHL